MTPMAFGIWVFPTILCTTKTIGAFPILLPDADDDN